MSALLFAVMNVIVRAKAGDIPVQEQAFARGVAGVIVFAPAAIRHGNVLITGSGRVIWLRAICGALAVMCIFANLAKVPAADVTALSNIAPIFVVLVSVLLFKQRVSRGELVSLGLVLIGIFVLQSPLGSHLPGEVVAVGVLGSAFAGFALAALREAATKMPTSIIVWTFSVALAVASIGSASSPWVVGNWGVALVLTLIAVLGVAAQYLMTAAYKSLSAPAASGVVFTVVLWAMVLEALFLGRVPPIGSVFGYALIVGGVILVRFVR